MKVAIRTSFFTVGNMNINAGQKKVTFIIANIKKYLFLPLLIISLNKNKKQIE